MTDILREVDEAMRVEKMARMWEEHKTVLITGITALILGTAAHSAWNAYDASKKRESTGAFISALDSAKPLEQLEKLATEESGSNRSLPLMSAASKAVAAGKFTEAIGFYDSVIKDKNAPAIFRDLAIVQKANLSLDHVEGTKASDLIAAVDPVASNAKSPWQGQALMTRAVIKAHAGNDLAAAIADLKLVTANDATPDSLRQRAQALIDTYQSKQRVK